MMCYFVIGIGSSNLVSSCLRAQFVDLFCFDEVFP